MLGMTPILPAECVAAAKRREEGGELSLEAAETLFWLRGVPAAGDSDDSDSDDEGDRDMNGLKTPRLMMTPPEASRLARCPNCGFYGIVGAGEATEWADDSPRPTNERSSKFFRFQTDSCVVVN